MAVVLVTHDIGVVSDYAMKVGCLNRRQYIHDSGEITDDMLTSAYQCPVERSLCRVEQLPFSRAFRGEKAGIFRYYQELSLTGKLHGRTLQNQEKPDKYL